MSHLMKHVPHLNRSRIAVAISLACLTFMPCAFAEEETLLPTVNVSDSEESAYGFVAKRARSTAKSDAPLFETPQSISVVTRELLDSKQATTLSQAIQGVAGVTSGSYGRRGWDDFYIRGQNASDSIYVDGLRLTQANWFAQEVFGVEQVEVLKGPASINFGFVQPGGMVNMVSKRPRNESFNEVGVTVGSYGYKQASFDFGRTLSESGKTAFRVNGMATDQDDPTDFVYFKSQYLAPSLSLDLGPNTQLTLLAALTNRKYIRQQGVPLRGSIDPNPNTSFSRSLFTGDPGIGAYQADQFQVGYALTHQLDSGWKLNQNFRVQEMNMKGRAVFLNGLAANGVTQSRNGRLQDNHERSIALDSNIEREFDIQGLKHTVMVGLDLNRDQLRVASTTCTVPSLNLNNPVYNVAINCPATATADATTTLSYTALYLRDRIKLNDRTSLNIAARRDFATNELNDYVNKINKTQSLSATTGNIALMYQATANVAPYISFATSFLPLGGTDSSINQFKPERGRQGEVGAKFQFDQGRINAAIARYELTRENALSSDPNNSSYSIQVGEQHTKGFEAELNADLRNGWSVSSAFAFINARVTKDTTLPVGALLQNIPQRTFSTWGNYQFREGTLRGFGYGLGLRHESGKTSPSVTYFTPSYTVADASMSYQGNGYRLMLNIKNLFNKDYFAGVINSNVIPLGDPRTVMLKTLFDF